MDLSLYLQICFTMTLLFGVIHILFYSMYKSFDKCKWAVIPSAISILIVLLSLLAIILGLIWWWL